MNTPLADRLRPKTIEEVAGQKHLLAEGKVLRRIIDSKNVPNLIFYGPSGVGKTTVANIIAATCGKKLHYLNATTASTADIKEIISTIGTIEAQGGILLYLDEIQYFNKKQQQILLSYIENGDITLIAATTENPYFYVYNAILSRSTVFEFKALSPDDIKEVLIRAKNIISSEKSEVNSDTNYKCLLWIDTLNDKPDIVSEIVGIEPSRKQIKGAHMGGKKPPEAIWKINTWEFVSPTRYAQNLWLLQESFEDVLNMMDRREKEFIAIAKKYDNINFQLQSTTYLTPVSFKLDTDVLYKLKKYHGYVCFSIWTWIN